MSNYSNEQDRDYRAILAWIILALQILGLLWLLLGGRDRIAALTGAEAGRVAEATAVVAATQAPRQATATAASPTEPAATPAVDSAATEAAAGAATATAQASTAAVIRPEEVLIDPSDVAPEWLATLVEQSEGNTAGGQPPIPSHLLLTFVDPANPAGETAALDAIDLNQPQLRIIPIATLLSMLQESNNEAGQKALEDLLSLLQQQPDPDQASIPVPPVLGLAVQNFVSRGGYREFGGGSGIGYYTNITGEDVVPVTNESGLNYVYQGLTADGEQYVFLSWPVDATFLPETAGDVPQGTVDALLADQAAYFDNLADQVATAAEPELSPSPSRLAALLNSLSIGGQVAAPLEEAPLSSAFDAVGFNWYWTGRAGPDGQESEVENPQDYSLVLWPDGTYSIRADCNVGGGTYTYDADATIQLNPGPLTRARCLEGSRENEFIESLLAARTIAYNESGDMVLGLADGGAMTLANVGEVEFQDVSGAGDQPLASDAGLAGVTWQWLGYTNAGGETLTVDNPEDYLLTLLPDGTFSVVADCNVGGGAYTYDEDGNLQLGPIRLTKMACRDGSRGDEFVNFLKTVHRAEVGDDGTITLKTATGDQAEFSNVGEVGMSAESAAGEGSTAEESAQTTPEGDPFNTVWRWTAHTPAGGAPTMVDDPSAYYLVLIDDGTYAFRADCNNGAGGYTLEGSNLTMNPAAMTLAACGEESLSNDFVDFLGRVRLIDFDDDGNLVLTLDDEHVLNFANGGPFTGTDTGTGSGVDLTPSGNPLAATVWQWLRFRDAKQDYDVSGDYTISFIDDETVSVVADCNQANGTYRIDDVGITISILASSLAACPAGSLGDSFIEYLNLAETFTIEADGTLVINLMADGGTMTFGAMQ